MSGKNETRGRKPDAYMSFQTFESKFDVSKHQRLKIARENKFRVYQILPGPQGRRYSLAQVEAWRKSLKPL